MLNHRISTVTAAAITAAALTVPSAASAAPVYDNGLVGGTPPQEVRADGQSPALPFAGGALVVLLSGAGVVALRRSLPRQRRSMSPVS